MLIVELFLKNPFFWILILLAAISLLFYKQIIGKAGEYHVKKELAKLPKDQYFIINDFMIRVNQITHQIDHIVISLYGIFVIETKQYNGYIVGNEYAKKWKQNKKHYINNPIHQNYGHIKALEELLKIPENKFISIVCIPSNAKLKIRSKSHVLKLYELNQIILSYQDVIIDHYKTIYDTLLKENIIDKSERKTHVQYVQKIKNDKDANTVRHCPQCGGTLVVRNGKNGEFLGCSNYPKCKYTENKNLGNSRFRRLRIKIEKMHKIL